MGGQNQKRKRGQIRFTTSKKGKVVHINYDWCKGCKLCVEFCPTHVYEASVLGQPVVIHPEKCNACMICVQRCPDFCIFISDDNEESAESCTSAVMTKDVGGPQNGRC